MKSPAFPFERQRIVTPHLIAFRIVQALLAARLVEIGTYGTAQGELVIGAIEAWLADIVENDTRELEEVYSLRPYIRRRRDREQFERAVGIVGEMRAKGAFPPAADASI